MIIRLYVLNVLDVGLNGLDEKGYLVFVERARPYFYLFVGVNEGREWKSPLLNHHKTRFKILGAVN